MFPKLTFMLGSINLKLTLSKKEKIFCVFDPQRRQSAWTSILIISVLV